MLRQDIKKLALPACATGSKMLKRPDLSRPRRPKRKTLSDEQKTEIREAFDLFDLEQTGKIDYHQLKVAMRALGFDVRKKDVLQLMEDYDLQRTGFIDYDQFLDIMTARISARDPDEEVPPPTQNNSSCPPGAAASRHGPHAASQGLRAVRRGQQGNDLASQHATHFSRAGREPHG